jgi:hypothetical protein
MTPRSYAIGAIAIPAGFFLCVVLTNLIIDPEVVFGTGLLGHSQNENTRYLHVAEYRRSADQVDGLLFGSSRIRGFPIEDLSRSAGGLRFARFSFQSGQMNDYLPVLEYVLRTKAANGQKLKSVFLMLDVDSFGTFPLTNRAIHFYLPPEVSGESAWRFWMRNLSAVQFATWRFEIRRFWRERREGATPTAARRPPVPGMMQGRTIGRTMMQPQLERLARFVELCREQGVQLTVATSPLNHVSADRYSPVELAGVVAQLRTVVPVWDFSDPDWLSGRPELWEDESHFVPDVSRMMLERIFNRTTGSLTPLPAPPSRTPVK